MKKLLAIITALMIGIPTYASIVVSPTRIEINANKLKNNYATSAVEVKGDSTRPIRFRAYTGYFRVSDKADIIFDDNKNDPYNMSSKLRFVPSEFTIPPGKSQKVRVNIANINSLPDGESRAIIYFEDVNAKEFNVPQAGGIGAQLILKTRVGVPVYVDKGNFTKKADVESFGIVREKDGLYTQMKVVSTGNSRIRYNGAIQIIDGKKLIDEYSIDGSVVGNNNTYTAKQKIETDKITKAGEYTIRLIFYYKDEKDNRKTIKKDTILKITGEI